MEFYEIQIQNQNNLLTENDSAVFTKNPAKKLKYDLMIKHNFRTLTNCNNLKKQI